MSARHFLFLYLDTGGGHLAPARILKESLSAYCNSLPEADNGFSVTLLNGFGPRQFVSHSFFEKGYHTVCSVLPAAYSAFYTLTTWKPALHVTKQLCSWRTVSYLEKILRETHVTDVVCFHFAVAPAAKRAVNRVNPHIPFTVVVTDPYTAHPAWFLVKNARFAVFSAQLKACMHTEYGIGTGQPDCPHVQVFPFLLGNNFCSLSARDPAAEKADCLALRRTYGIPPEHKVVLIAGGGEGLPGMVRLIREFVCNMPQDMTVLSVCGRDKRAYERICRLKKQCRKDNLIVSAYTEHMDDLMRIADCIVTKAGASTVMEIVANRKPVVFSAYIHGQELGNVRFAVSAGIGWFLRKPRDIYAKVAWLCGNRSAAEKVREQYAKLGFVFDNKKIVSWIWNDTGVQNNRNALY